MHSAKKNKIFAISLAFGLLFVANAAEQAQTAKIVRRFPPIPLDGVPL
jgi:hypothetical protein